MSAGSSTGYAAVQDDFAPAQFFDLSDSDKLSRPSFERHNAGAIMSGSSLVTNGSPLGKTLDYESFFINTPGVVTVDEGLPQPFPWTVLPIVMRSGSAARKAISQIGAVALCRAGQSDPCCRTGICHRRHGNARSVSRHACQGNHLQRCRGSTRSGDHNKRLTAQRLPDRRDARTEQGHPLMADTKQAYTLLPWVRRGIGSQVTGALLPGGQFRHRATLDCRRWSRRAGAAARPAARTGRREDD